MSFLRSRSEQLADYLRERIRQGQFHAPLPTTRVWSSQLGVSRPTLHAALLTLQREGLLAIKPRGIRLRHAGRWCARKFSGSPRVVRLLYYGGDFPESSHFQDWLAPLSEALHLRQISLVVEKSNDVRLRIILKRKHRRGELFFLLGLAPVYQRLFAKSRRPALILGEPAPWVPLPFITDDQDGAVRHATQALLRRGFSRLDLLMARVSSYGIRKTIATFQAACAEWPHQPVLGRVVLLPLQPVALLTAAHRYAAQIKERRGIVVVASVPVSLIMTALMGRGVAVPGTVQIAAVLHPAASVQVDPRPLHYPPPTQRGVREMVSVAVHYFETGRVPMVRKTLPVELHCVRVLRKCLKNRPPLALPLAKGEMEREHPA